MLEITTADVIGTAGMQIHRAKRLIDEVEKNPASMLSAIDAVGRALSDLYLAHHMLNEDWIPAIYTNEERR